MSIIDLTIFTARMHFGVVILALLSAGIVTAIVSFILISAALRKDDTKKDHKEHE